MRGRVGLKEVAERLGVDVSTVSRALRGDARVRAETVQAVRATAEALGYRPNVAARALRGGTTGRVAVLLSPPQQRFASPIFLELLATLDQGLRATDRSLSVFAARTRDEEPAIVRRIVEERQADALIIGRTRQRDARVDILLEAGVPFVTFGRTAREEEHPWVEIDYRRAGELAVEALAISARESLHVLAGPRGLRFSDGYVAGVRAAAKRLGLVAPVVKHLEMTEEAGEREGRRLVARRGRHAVACIQDSLAFGLYRASAAAGERIGERLAVFGGQNFPGSEHAAPPLSTFSTADADVAALLTRVMLTRLDGPVTGTFETHIVDPEPLLRRSHLLSPRSRARAA